MMADMRRFDFAFDPAYLRLSRALGVRPDTAWVEVDDDTFLARFGRWRFSTPLSNITGVEITGPYAFWKTAGPARYAITDSGLTFATNGDRGVLILLRRKEPGLDPFGLIRHPEITVTVADVVGLAALLRERAGPAMSSGA